MKTPFVLAATIALSREELDSQFAEIVFVPLGSHDIEPHVIGGAAQKFTVGLTPENGPDIAARMDATLRRRLAAQNVRPIIDFDHDVLLNGKGPAAAIPSSISFDSARGIVMTLEWTASGKKAIEGRDYSYFSPVMTLNGELSEPFDLAEEGPIGGLVNSPAFRDIPRIAASRQPSKKTKTTMKNLLVLCGLLAPNAIEGKDDDGAVAVATAEVKSLREKGVGFIKVAFSNFVSGLRTSGVGNTDTEKEEAVIAAAGDDAPFVKALIAGTAVHDEDGLKRLGFIAASALVAASTAEAALAELREGSATEAVKTAVAAGRIAPKDTKTQDWWRARIAEEGQVAIDMLNAQGKVAAGKVAEKGKVIAKAQSNNEGGETLNDRAEAIIAAGATKSYAEALSMASKADPELYESHRESYGPKPTES